MLTHTNFYLVGIKGVGMTALAGCLCDAGKHVRGSDVAVDFVTAPTLQRLQLRADSGFSVPLPADTEIVIWSGANGGSRNPQVIAARRRGIPTMSQAEALGVFFNQQLGVAVSGVGGKSTISAMLAVISEQIEPQSYAVGVGEILGWPQTGRYRPQAQYFIAEADEYTTDPADKSGLRPRFSFLRPQITITTSLRFDHPDVYRDFAHTQQVYQHWWGQIRPSGALIYNADASALRQAVAEFAPSRPDLRYLSYARRAPADYTDADLDVTLAVPGQFNRSNALAALAAAELMGWSRPSVLTALTAYRSVKRRLEYLGERQGIKIWDDYAHHPAEITAAITAMKEHDSTARLVVAFQPHTFSRTKQLRAEFVAALAAAPEVLLVDIFPSAREEFDPNISSAMLATDLRQRYPQVHASHVGGVPDLHRYINQNVPAGSTLLLLGAGDIYQVVTQM
jgi:UDP-N-acetylmuramate--alanine ligase